MFEIEARHGDRLLLCSDGLFNEVPIDVIAERLREVDDIDLAARELVEHAVSEGGRDNVSVVLLDIVEDRHASAIRGEAESARRPTPMAAAAVFDKTESETDKTPSDEPLLDNERSGRVSADPRPTDRVPVVGAVATAALLKSSELAIDQRPGSSGDPSDGSAEGERLISKERSRARWATIAVIVTVLIAFLGINWFGSSAYFATEQSGEVVIFRGRPGGILWVDPELERATGLAIEDLAPAGVLKLEEELEWASLEAAIEFVDQLERIDPDEAES